MIGQGRRDLIAPRPARVEPASRLALGVAALLVLALATSLRLWAPDLTEFKGDEATALWLAEDLVRTGRVPLTGLGNSAGLANAAHFVYALAPVVAVSRDPAFAAGVVGATSVAATLGALWLGWRRFGPLAGLTAGLLFAINPWAAFYGRKLWANDLLPAVAVLFVVALDRGVLGRRTGWALAALPLFALGTLLHFSFGLLAPLLLAPVGWLLATRRWRALGLGVGLSLLAGAPYLAANARSGWSELRGLVASAAGPSRLDLDGLAFTLSAATGWQTDLVAGVPVDAFAPLGLVRLASALETGLLALAVLLALGRALAGLRPGGDRALAARLAGLVLWLLLPAALTLRHTLPLYPHYFLMVYPAPFLLIGTVVQWLGERTGRGARPALATALGALLLVAGVQAAVAVGLLDHLGRRYEPAYGLPLRASRSLADEVVALAAERGAGHVVLEADGSRGTALAYLLRPALEVAVSGRGTVSLVAPAGRGADTIYLALEEPTWLAETLPGAEPERRPVAALDGAPTVTLLTLDDETVRRLVARAPEERRDLRYEAGLCLLGATFPERSEPGRPVPLALAWTVEDPDRAAGRDLAWEVTLYDWEGRGITRASDLGHEPTRWLAGDQVVSWFALGTATDLRPGTYRLGVRLIDRARGQAVPFSSPDGRRGSEWSAEPIALRRRLAAEVPADLEGEPALLGTSIRLLGFRWLGAAPARLQPGGALAFEVVWQADAEISGNYTVFAQLVGERTNPRTGNRVWAQVDRLPQEGRAPTSGWAAGSVVPDAYRLELPADLPPGRYDLQVGLYDAGTGERLPVKQGGVADAERRVLLATLPAGN